MSLANWLIAPQSRRNAIVLSWVAVLGIAVADDLTGIVVSATVGQLHDGLNEKAEQ